MEIKQNPFSFYDFLGYLTPGAIFLYILLFITGHINSVPFSFSHISSQLSFERAEVYIPFVLAAYISGHFLGFLSSITIERYSIWAHDYPSKYLLGVGKRNSYFPEGNAQNPRRIIRFFFGIFLTPIALLDWGLGQKASMRDLYAKSLDPLLIDVLQRKIALLMLAHAEITPEAEKHETAAEIDFFRYAYHFAVENAPNHLPKMQNYVALYGFLRTLTFIFLLVYWVIWWHTLTGIIPIAEGLLLMCGASALTFLFFMAFVKFYRRFSLEALMAMAVSLPSINKSNI